MSCPKGGGEGSREKGHDTKREKRGGMGEGEKKLGGDDTEILHAHSTCNSIQEGRGWLEDYHLIPGAISIMPTGGVQIIVRNSQFFSYFVTKTKKNTGKNNQRSKAGMG